MLPSEGTHHMRENEIRDLVIRLATLADARAIAEIHVASWQSAYSDLLPEPFLRNLSVEKRTTLWSDVIAARRAHVSVASVADRLVGWIAYGRCRDRDKPATWAEIEAMYLDPEYCGQGIGTALIDHASHALKEQGYEHVSLWVLAGNVRARAFYKRTGFVEDNRIKTIEIGASQFFELRYRRVI